MMIHQNYLKEDAPLSPQQDPHSAISATRAIQDVRYNNSAAFIAPSDTLSSQNKLSGNQPHVHVSIVQYHNIGIGNNTFEKVAKPELLGYDITS
jgi:hypothetical protein